MSTLIGFSLGNPESSPFIRLLIRWGPLTGLILSKLLAAGLATGCVLLNRSSLIRAINYWYAALVIWNLYASLSVLTHAPRPGASLSPDKVIKTVAEALRTNNSPLPNAGVFTAYRFASPANHAVTGPYGRFLRTVQSLEFAPMLHELPEEFGRIEIAGDRAEQLLTIRMDHGQTAVYRFSVSRQSGGACRGCWMVDGVSRLR